MAKKKKKPDFSKPKEEPKKSLSVDLEAESSEIVENAASSDESEEISDNEEEIVESEDRKYGITKNSTKALL